MHSLRLRFFLILFLVAVLAISVVAFFANRGTTSSFNTYVAQNFTRDQKVIKELLEIPIEDGDLEEAEELAVTVGEAYGRPVILSDQEGQVIFSTETTLVELAPEIQYIEVEDRIFNEKITHSTILETPLTSYNFIVGPEKTIEIIVDPSLIERKIFPFPNVAPESLTSEPVATASNETRFLGSVSQTFWIATLTAVLLAGILSLGLSRRILKPIEALTFAARQMEKGNLSQQVQVNTKDEIGTLARAFNKMATSLATQETLRRNMVSDVAHELRTPLSNIQGYLEAVQDGVLAADDNLINSLHEESLLLNRLIEDLQELSLAEAGQLRLHKQLIDVGGVITQAVSSLRPKASEKSITLQTIISPDLPQLELDQERIGQLLRNLISNGIEHTATKGMITITAVSDATQLIIQVQDNGEGIPPEHIDYIFDRFYRVDESRSRESGGSGLGLAISKALIEMHEGTIEATSTVAAGTTFTLSFPISDEQFV